MLKSPMMNQECPQCGYGTTNKSRNDATRTITQGEISLVQDRIRALESKIANLNEERVRLLQRCNELKSPVNKYLPPEVLSNIFRLACSGEITEPHLTAELLAQTWSYNIDPSNWETNGPYVPVVLGSVCSFWRHVVRSTPQVWTTIALEVRHRTAVSHAHLLRLYLSASRTLPCSVEVDCRREKSLKEMEEPSARNGKLEEALLPIRNVLFDPANTQKITQLHLTAPPPEWVPLIPTSYPRLRSLSLSRFTSQVSTQPFPSLDLDLRESYHLTYFALNGDIGIVLPWSQITDLALAGLTPVIALEILLQCENLKRCRVRNLHTIRRAHEPTRLQKSLVTLKNLSFLEWAPSITTRPTNLFFECLELPALHRLQWNGHFAVPGDPGSWNLVLQFFARLPTTMTEINITEGSFLRVDSQGIRDLLNTIPQLEMLTIYNVSHALIVILVIEALGLGNPSQAGQPFLPALRTLEVKGALRSPLSRIDELRACLIKMLQDRCRLSNLGLCVKLDLPLEWPDDGMGDLRELIRSGSGFELWQEGERIG